MNKNTGRAVVGAIETNCWFYAFDDAPGPGKPRPCAVIDPGDEAPVIISRLEGLNWIPACILFTHGHFDHVAALPDLLEAFTGGVWAGNPIPWTGIHRLDAGYLGKDALALHRESFSAAGGDPSYVDALWKPLPAADCLFEEGSTAGPFKVLHLPGHTRGSVGFYDGKAGVLFSGDTLFQGTWGRTDLPGGDWGDLRRSLARLLPMKGETTVYPGHGAPTTTGQEAGMLRLEL